MPAVDPHRLNSQIAQLQDVLHDPVAMRWRVRDLLEYYSDRTRRPGGVKRHSDATRSFGVLKPILLELQHSLVTMLADDSDAALSIANELWDEGIREMRIVAIGLLDNVSPDVSLAQIEHWTGLTEDPKIVEKLAAMSFAVWKTAPQAELFQKIKQWITGSNIAYHTFALLVLRRAARDLEMDHLPHIFDLLKDVALQNQASTRSLFLKLLQDLAVESPAETAKFLLNRIEGGDLVVKRMAREILSVFPARQRSRIKQALSP